MRKNLVSLAAKHKPRNASATMGSHNNEITSFVIGRLNNPFRRMLIFHMNDITFQTVRGPSLCRSIENFLGSRLRELFEPADWVRLTHANFVGSVPS